MAQESQKRRIVLASVLKPVDDTRMTEKMGASLAATGLYEVSVIGYPSTGSLPPGIRPVPLTPFKRISWARWLARWKVFWLALALRPNVFIFSTHELIFPALVLKVLLNTRIIYDVRENYYRNIRYSEGLPSLIRWPLAALVRFKEKLMAPAIDHFILAEEGYDKEFRFHRGGWTVIENKAIATALTRQNAVKEHLTLLFSGTLSESTGVFRAIDLASILHQHHPGVRLTIAGYAASGSVRQKLMASIKDKPFIQTIGIDRLVPHNEILALLPSVDAGLIAYFPLPHTINSVPTKLFEYLQARLPIITENHWPWVQRFDPYKPFVFVNFADPDVQSLLNALTNNSFYTQSPVGISWNMEASRLIAAIKLMV